MPLWLIGFGNWLKKVPGWVWFAVAAAAAACFAIYLTDRNARKDERQKDKIEDLEDTIVLNEKAEEIVDAIEQRVEGAEAAVARLPWLRSTRELRDLYPELAALIVTDPDKDNGPGGGGDLRRDAPAPDAAVAPGRGRPD